MKKSIIIALAFFFLLSCLYAQDFDLGIEEAAPEEAAEVVDERLMLAISNENYPVTPGDIYRITFLTAGETVSNEILVQSDYTLNLTVFGKVNASGMTYANLKPVVEKIVADAYPNSLPSCAITSVGIFQVLIKGDIPQTRYVTAWGLSRLSEVIRGNIGSRSSIRDIGILSKHGIIKKYDLFKALQMGAVYDNPHIKPGDTIIISSSRRIIEVQGEVNRPGRYQLLANEEPAELIENFAGGLTSLANRSRVKLDRIADINIQTLYFDISQSYDAIPDLQDGDILTIPSKTEYAPVIVFEGAVSPAEAGVPEAVEAGAEAAGGIYGRIPRTFREGETLYDVLQTIRDSISSSADLPNTYIIRQGESQPIMVNIEKLLYAYVPSEDITLKPFDRIIIPSVVGLVSVSGAVYTPGSYPYTPGKTFTHYVELAAGIDPERNTDNRVSITDSQGVIRDSFEIIQPGDRIYIHTNNFVYNFNRYFPIITSAMAFITTIITIVDLLVQ